MKPSTPPKAFGAAILVIVLFVWFRGCNGLDPFEEAILFGDLPKMEKHLKAKPALANKKFSDTFTPIGRAIGSMNEKAAIEMLLKYGADVNAKVWPGDLTPLQSATWGGRIEAVKALLAHNPDVNALTRDNQTAMHYAISVYMSHVSSKSGNNVGQEIMELLLAHGADINRGTPILTAASHYANNADLIEFLLSKGANPE
jgi:ankyrin repeat protein